MCMHSDEISHLQARVDRLERRSRGLTVVAGLAVVAALVGWKDATPSALRVSRLEVVDDRGVPMVVLAPDRNNAGGSVTLRDRNGERRAWFTAAPGSAALTLNSEGKDGEGDSTLGLAVSPRQGRLSILSKGGAALSATMTADQPHLELTNPHGKPLFTAPWK